MVASLKPTQRQMDFVGLDLVADNFVGGTYGVGLHPGWGVRNWQPIAATSGTDTFFANNSLFVTSLLVPTTKLITGVGFLLGSVGGTDKVIVSLYSSTGAVLANSTTASSGTTAGTAANTQEIPFTSTLTVQGPQVVWVGVAANGGTAKLRTVPAFTGGGIWGNSLAWTHGTVAAITPPTALTADKAPIVYLY